MIRLILKARTGLVAQKKQVTRGGKTYQTTVWVRPNKKNKSSGRMPKDIISALKPDIVKELKRYAGKYWNFEKVVQPNKKGKNTYGIIDKNTVYVLANSKDKSGEQSVIAVEKNGNYLAHKGTKYFDIGDGKEDTKEGKSKPNEMHIDDAIEKYEKEYSRALNSVKMPDYGEESYEAERDYFIEVNNKFYDIMKKKGIEVTGIDDISYS